MEDHAAARNRKLGFDLVAWLTQATPGWNAVQPTVRATGATVPYPPSSVPTIPPPGGQSFFLTAATVDPSPKQVTLTWNSEVGFRYSIWASSDLQTWSQLLGDISPSASVTTRTATDSSIGELPRFYRIEVRRP